MDLNNKRVLVVGIGRSGVASAFFLQERGALVTVSDSKTEAQLQVEIAALLDRGISIETGRHGERTFRDQDLIVVSPGVPSDHPQLQQARILGIPVIGEVELAFRFLQGKVIAITGSNGKTTTTTLIGEILTKSGKKTLVGGNIGTPVISLVEKSTPESYIVLEVSSFQLETIQQFRPWISVVLNITPDHLDRHHTFQGYVDAKARMFENQTASDFAVLNADDATCVNLKERLGRLNGSLRARLATQPRSYYVPAGGSADLTKLFADCTGVANASVDFSPFVGINLMFNGDLDGYAWGGNRYATLDGKSGSWRVTWEPPWGYQHEAPLAHEMGHGFGLPHANNSDHDSDPYDNPWDVMSDAWDDATSDATFGAQPKHINIFHRDRLGWVDAARKLTISAAGTLANLQLDAAELIASANLQMIVVTLPGAPATHYYTIEARRAGVAGDLYDHDLAGSAVIVHEIDTTRQEPAWSVDAQLPPANVADDAGSMFKTGETWTAPNSAFSVSVTAASANGFVVSVSRAADDQIFRNGF